MKNKKGTFIKIIMDLILIFPSVISLFSNIASLITMEARLAGNSIFVIALFSMIFASLLSVSWLCLLALLFMYFTSMHLGTVFSLFFVFLINTLILLVIGLVMLKVKNNLLHPTARKSGGILCKCKDSD